MDLMIWMWNILPNGGLMVIYHGRIRKQSPTNTNPRIGGISQSQSHPPTKPLSDADTRHCNESSQLHILQNWRGKDNQKDVELTCNDNFHGWISTGPNYIWPRNLTNGYWENDVFFQNACLASNMASCWVSIWIFLFLVVLLVFTEDFKASVSQASPFWKLRGKTFQGRKVCQTSGHPEVKGKTSSKNDMESCYVSFREGKHLG